MLVPQIEHWIRIRLKEHGVNTMFTDEFGVETEKGLGTLLDDPLAAEAVSQPVIFELKTVLTEQVGPNLRNDGAHGLIDDHAANSDEAVYAWWIALKLVMLPLADRLADEQALGEAVAAPSHPLP